MVITLEELLERFHANDPYRNRDPHTRTRQHAIVRNDLVFPTAYYTSS